jgi:hypothetical protein
MNTTETPNFSDYILFTCHLPALKLDGIPGYLMARLLQDAIEPALQREGLLVDLSKLPLLEAIKAQAEKTLAVDANLQNILQDSALSEPQKEALSTPFRQLRDDTARIFSGRPMWILPGGEMFFGSLYVTDMKRGLLTLESEFKRLAFLERSKIGQYDAEHRVWRTYFPKNSSQTFDDFAAGILKLFGLTKP